MCVHDENSNKKCTSSTWLSQPKKPSVECGTLHHSQLSDIAKETRGYQALTLNEKTFSRHCGGQDVLQTSFKLAHAV